MNEVLSPPASEVIRLGQLEIRYLQEAGNGCRMGAFEMRVPMATPCGVVHAFSNPHAAVARALVINTPDIGAQYFREVKAIIDAGGPPDRAKLTATMQKFGLVPAAPRGAQPR